MYFTRYTREHPLLLSVALLSCFLFLRHLLMDPPQEDKIHWARTYYLFESTIDNKWGIGLGNRMFLFFLLEENKCRQGSS
jgi:hypothetical protein